MVEPAKPFACTIQGCGMTFTNEDHLHVHTKKHDMVLQFGSAAEQKAAFVADQTPTPTRFIRNCEEVGLFQDLQNVNPFDEGFKRAMESKQGILDGANTTPMSTDDLHTPQMFPLIDSGDSVFTTNQRNITISRSSSDESGAIKEFETTTISKLTNEVTTISRVVEKHEELLKNDDPKKGSRKDVSIKNNVIKILSNVEIRNEKPVTEDVIKKETVKDYLQVPPIMSQQSIDNLVDRLTSDYSEIKKEEIKKEESKKDYEVILKLPSGQQIKLTSAEVEEKPKKPKDLLKKVLTDKVDIRNNLGPVMLPGAIPIAGGTLIPVSLLNTGMSIVNNSNVLPKLPLKVFDKRPVKRKTEEITPDKNEDSKEKELVDKESRKAASKRYRIRDKAAKQKLVLENNQLKRLNEKLQLEKTSLKVMIMEHMKKCPNCDDFRNYLSNSH